VPLSQLADIRVVDGPVKIDREKSSRMSVVRANVRDRDLVGFVDEARPPWRARCRCHRATAGLGRPVREPAARRRPPGAGGAGGAGADLRLLFATLGLRQALLVFANIPFALVGGVWRWP
jgi:cobalt-zinc-cadmium resistance protein CzcA